MQPLKRVGQRLGTLLKWIARLTGLALALGVLGFVALALAVDLFGRADRAQPADAIVVLGAQVLEDGSPGPDLLPRTQKAVALYHAGMAPALICTGGIAGDPWSAAAVSARTAVSMGVPADAVFIADGSNNTREDTRRAVEIMRQHGWQSLIVVSHPMHLLRGTLLLRHAGATVYPSPTSTEVGRIPPRWRVIYAVREAGLIVLDKLYPEGEIGVWAYRLWYWLESQGITRILFRERTTTG